MRKCVNFNIREAADDSSQRPRIRIRVSFFALFALLGFLSLFSWNVFVASAELLAGYGGVAVSSMFRAAYVVQFVAFILQIGLPIAFPPNKSIVFRLGVSLFTVLHTIGVLIGVEWFLITGILSDLRLYAIFTCAALAILHITTAAMISNVYYMVGRLNPCYATALLIGTNLAGVLTSIARLFSPDQSHLLWVVAFVVGVVALLLLIVARRNHMFNVRPEAAHPGIMRTHNRSPREVGRTVYSLFRGSTAFQLNLGLIVLNYAAFLTTFPLCQLGITLHRPEVHWWKSLLVIVNANVFILLGNIATLVMPCHTPNSGKFLRLHISSSVLRVVAVFVYYAVRYSKGPILIGLSDDIMFAIVNAVNAFGFGASSSYFFAAAPGIFQNPKRQSLASLMASVAMITGLALGAIASLFFVTFIPINL